MTIINFVTLAAVLAGMLAFMSPRVERARMKMLRSR